MSIPPKPWLGPKTKIITRFCPERVAKHTGTYCPVCRCKIPTKAQKESMNEAA